jgi:nitrate reductase NapE component
MYPRKSNVLYVSASSPDLDPHNGRRRQSGIASFQRTFGLIPILVLASLGGFGVSRGRFSIDRSFLGKMRARNQKLVVLQRNSKNKELNNSQKKGEIVK